MIVGALLALPAPASADTPEVFAGTAGARALNLGLLGINVTLGSSNALADSTPSAKANGAGLLLAPTSTSSAEANGANASQTPPKACALNIPLVPVLTLAAACSQSGATTTNGSPTATSEATVADLDLQALQLLLDLLDPILDALAPVIDGVVGQVTGALTPLLGGLLDPLLGSLGLDLSSPVASLRAALLDVTSLIRVSVGDTTSKVTTSAGTVSSVATAEGGRIDVLPGLTVAGGPLLSIVLGSAKATAEYDRSSGKSTPSFDPALLTLSVLGLNVPVALGAPLVLFPGTVLESSISLGAGRTVTNPDGTVAAVADGVSLQLLKGLSGGIVLELAHAEAAAGGGVAKITTQSSTPPVQQVKELARTGGLEPWLPLGGLLLLAAYLTRRVARVRP